MSFCCLFKFFSILTYFFNDLEIVCHKFKKYQWVMMINELAISNHSDEVLLLFKLFKNNSLSISNAYSALFLP